MITNAPITNTRKVRVLGTLLFLVGCGALWWQWGVFANHDTIDLKIGFFGPFITIIAPWFVIEAPPIPPRRFTKLGVVLFSLGILAGVVNLVWLKFHTVPVRLGS